MTFPLILIGCSRSGDEKVSAMSSPGKKASEVSIKAPPALMSLMRSSKTRSSVAQVTGIEHECLGSLLRSLFSQASRKPNTRRLCNKVKSLRCSSSDPFSMIIEMPWASFSSSDLKLEAGDSWKESVIGRIGPLHFSINISTDWNLVQHRKEVLQPLVGCAISSFLLRAGNCNSVYSLGTPKRL